MGFNEVLSSWSSSEEEDGHDHDEDRDQVLKKPYQYYFSITIFFDCLYLTNSFKTDRDKEQEEIAAQEAQEEMAQQEMDNDLCMQNEIDAEIDMTMNEAMNDCAD